MLSSTAAPDNGDRRETSESKNGAADRLPRWPIALALALSFGTAFWGIAQPEFWHDEVATISAVTRPFPELLQMLRNVDAVHALYYVLMHPWAAVFGTSELAMRTPSAIALILMSGFLTRTTMRWAVSVTGEGVSRSVISGVLTAVLAAALPGLTWAGQEARGYAMGMLACVVALWCFENYLRGYRRADLLGFGVAQILAVGFTMYSLLVVPLFVLRAVLAGRKPGLHTLMAAAGIGVAAAPLAVLAYSQSEQVAWINRGIPEMLQRMAAQYFFSPANADGHWGGIGHALAPWLALLSAVIVIVGLIRSRDRGLTRWLLAYALLPAVALLLARIVGMQLYTERYLAFAAPVVVALLALSLTTLPSRALRMVLIGVLVVGFIPSLVGQKEAEAKIGHEYRTAAEFLGDPESVIFMEAVDRSLIYAYPLDHPIEDPMLAEDRLSSDTLWGINREGWMAWEVPVHGRTAVVSYHSNEYHQTVVESLEARGCSVTGHDASTRFGITALDCSG